MRIVAGKYGSLNFDPPHGAFTHPMSEKIRGALFSTLGDLTGKTVLDAFAGSGAVGFEALSRGAKFVQAVEKDKQVAQVIQGNARKLKLGEEFKVTQANCAIWAENNPDRHFDIIIADPPFNKPSIEAIMKLVDLSVPGGLLVVSSPSKQPIVLYETSLKLLRQKAYGDAELSFYQLAEPVESRPKV